MRLSDIITTFFGLLTSVLTAYLLEEIESITHFAFYSWCFFFIIPVGAIISGALAASGFYFGARLLNQKANNSLMLNMVVISTLTFFGIYFIEYKKLETVMEMDGFWNYFKLMLTSTQMSFSSHGHTFTNTGSLGNWGYLFGGLQLIGFTLGGFVNYTMLSELIYCDECKKYYKKIKSEKKYSNNSVQGKEIYKTIAEKIQEGNFTEIGKLNDSFGHKKNKKDDVLSFKCELKQCLGCRKNHLSYILSEHNGKDWVEVVDAKINTQTDKNIYV